MAPIIRILVGAALLSLFFVLTPSRARAEAAQPAAAAHSSISLPAQPIETKTDDYARREVQHPETAEFRGGDSFGLYIGGSAGLVIVVLLVLLLLR